MNPVVCVSGGFDPLHFGHIRLIKNAADYGDVIVILNSDAWLERKKGYLFMPFVQRKEIVENIKGVISVEAVDDADGTVCEALRRIRPEFFANGGDRLPINTPELSLCTDLQIMPLFGVGGGKAHSSQALIDNMIHNFHLNESGVG